MPAASKRKKPGNPPPPPPPAPEATTTISTSSGGGWTEGNTRICVKNVPKHITETRLMEHFGQQGQVTDARLVKTKTGQSRKMAFIGFKTEEEAQAAVGFFHHTYLDTSKLQVEEAKPRGDPGLARPWSKHSQGSSRYEKEVGKKRSREESGVEEGVKRPKPGVEAKDEDEEVEEGVQKKDKARRIAKEDFLAAMMPRSQARSWANDEAELPVPMEEEEDDDGSSSSSINDGAGGSEPEPEEDQPGEEEPSAGLSDLDYLKSKVNKKLDEQVVVVEGVDDDGGDGNEDGEDEEELSSSGPVPKSKGGKKEGAGEGDQPSKKKDRDGVEEQEEGPEEDPSRLFIRNLPFSATEDDLKEAFARFGEVAEVHLPLDETKRPKGFGFVHFLMPDDAKKAIESMDGRAFQGRLIHITVARPVPKDALAGLDPAKARTYKERKEIERRQRAGDTRGWNASYVRSETVVDALADRLSVEKGSIMDHEAGDMAVRLAVGETLLQAENREVFEKEGVDLGVLEGAQKNRKLGAPVAKRSTTTLLVKNLPYSTTHEDLTKLFGKFGSLSKVVVPPSKALALVDYVEPSEARKAFKALAYKKFQHVPLYLEWAPLGTFMKKEGNEGVVQEEEKKEEVETVVAAEAEEEGEEASTSLFIKNLNFSTTEEGFKAFVSRKVQGVRAVSIPKKRKTNSDKKGDKSVLSMGFGFVEFTTASAARSALRSLNGAVLDGHSLECKISNKRLSEAPSTTSAVVKNKNKCRKLLVKNLAFQATAKEVSALFGSFGKVKTLRMPKKFDGKHRGFAFVEFLTSQEAENAMKSLSSTHLYGRHLVLEWAEEEGGGQEQEEAARRKKVVEEEKRRKKKEKIVREIVGEAHDEAEEEEEVM